MRYVVAYDCSNDRTRGKVARVLEHYGVRVQGSVFECDLDDRAMQAVRVDLARLRLVGKEAEVRFYRLCGLCANASGKIGGDDASSLDHTFFII